MINVYKDVINNTIIFDNKDKFNENTVNLIFLGKFSNLDYVFNKKNICTNKLFDDKNIVDKNIGKFFILRDRDNFEIYISDFKEEKLLIDNLGFNSTFIDVVGKIY